MDKPSIARAVCTRGPHLKLKRAACGPQVPHPCSN